MVASPLRRHWWALLLALAMATPVLAVAVLALGGGLSSWPNLIANVLPQLAITTVLLCGLCGLLSLILGTACAWLVSFYNFPGRTFLSWMALLPLALPGYIISFVYVDALTFAGPLQTALRKLFGWASPADYWFPEIRSVAGAAIVLSLALYPYVYLAARAAFLRQPANQLHVSRTLGRSPFRAFVEIALPQARPALFIGTLLVIIECLNDIGAATFFGVRTLTIAVYSTWLDQGDVGGAAQIAMLLLMVLGTLVYFESIAKSRTAHRTKMSGFALRENLPARKAFAAFVVLALPVLLGFVIPVLLLLGHSLRRIDEIFITDTVSALSHSLELAALACVLTVLIALALIYANRERSSSPLTWTTRLASLGYALPGAVLGLGILIPLGQFDQWMNAVLQSISGWKPGLVLSGGIFALVFAYVTRFLIITLSNIGDGMDKIPTHLDSVARTLGRTQFRAFIEIHLPLLKPSIIAASLLVLVDAMKELPVTLILRPFDFETLATRVFALASLGQFEFAAIPALAIVVVGLVPVIVLSYGLRHSADDT